MARAGIYKSEVLRARDKLLAAGRNPSIDAVREELGSGSKRGLLVFSAISDGTKS